MEGNFGGGKIWQIVFQTAFDKIKFGESLSGAYPKLYNCFTNDAAAHTVPLVKFIEAACLVLKPTCQLHIFRLASA